MARKSGLLFLVCVMMSVLLAGIASAHVVVYPKEGTQGSYEKFTVRVPSESEVPTVKVEVKIPDEVDVSRFEPKYGWTYEIAKDANDKITGVTWTTTGEGLSSTEFGEFNMQGKIAADATQLVWKAYQTLKDGSVVEWVGEKGSDKPASVTVINPVQAPDQAEVALDATAKATVPVAEEAAADNNSGSSNTALYLAIVGLVLGLISLIISLSKKAK